MRITSLALAALAGSATAQHPSAEAADERPSFTLPDLDGREHRLSAQRGKIVVLEWTSHACPAVAAAHESRMLLDTRSAVAGNDLVWWQVDSSWFAPAVEGDIRAWRDRLGVTGPYLLDADGAVARALGAVATPQVLVLDAAGEVAYSGAVCDRAGEERRANHVVAAVNALRDGIPVAVPQTRPIGCSVKIGRPRAEVDRAQIEDDPQARVTYRAARAAARSGDTDRALELLGRALDERFPWPTAVLADGAFRRVLADGGSRERVRELLRSRPARGRLTMVAPDEPGEPFVIAGTVRDEAGEPIPGAVVALYHTDHAGWYSEGSTEGRNARLFGSVATDQRGRYRVRTIMPARYADSTDGLQHVHMGFRAPGFAPHAGHRASLYFDDDPAMVGANRREIEGDGCAVVRRTANAEGVTLAVYDVTLRRE